MLVCLYVSSVFSVNIVLPVHSVEISAVTQRKVSYLQIKTLLPVYLSVLHSLGGDDEEAQANEQQTSVFAVFLTDTTERGDQQ